jgi:hypothetical protein
VTTTVAVRERPILFSGEMVRAILDGRKTQTRRVMQNQPFSNTIRFDRLTGNLDCYNDYLPPSATLLDVGRGANRYTTSLEEEGGSFAHLCPYGAPGDRLWVRETWTADFGGTFSDMPGAWWHEVPPSLRTEKSAAMLYYAADASVYHAPSRCEPDQSWDTRVSGWEPTELDLEGRRWRPSIHMPRWASRLTLEITDVRVQRVQEISNSDALAEGCLPLQMDHGNAIPCFEGLWDSLNAKRPGCRWADSPWVWAITFRRVKA